jgi:hypothetical protein
VLNKFKKYTIFYVTEKINMGGGGGAKKLKPIISGTLV